jgi:hypothetical protein
MEAVDVSVLPDALRLSAMTFDHSSVARRLVDAGSSWTTCRLVEIWPEFGAHGKDTVARRDALSHSA